MSDAEDPDRETAPAPTAAPKRPRRVPNSVEPLDRTVRRSRPAEEPLEVGAPGGPSHRPGDLPPSLTRRYFTETLRGGRTVALYDGPGAKRVALHDHGDRLTTDQSHPAVIRDMSLIAAHRGWSGIKVRGQDDFRREVWLQARALGIEVQGYRPRERDRQELAQRIAAVERSAPEASSTERLRRDAAGRQEPPERKGKSPPERPDFATGVAGILLEAGEAPYRRRTGEPLTPYIRLQREDGRILDVWGAGLPPALERSGAKAGDALRVKRDGVDVVRKSIEVRDPKTGRTSTQVRDVSRNRWVIEAERFRGATPGQAARDPDLRGAQSHLSILNSVIDQSVRDPRLRQELRAEARDLVADELVQGRRFPPARIREVEPVLARDVAAAHGREAAERVHRR